jgi:hypothetical protein
MILHVTCVAETTVSRLGGPFVVAHLQVKFTLVRPQLSVRERPFILVGHFWSKRWSREFRVFLGDPSEGEERQNHLEKYRQ